MSQSVHLGGGVYAGFDGSRIWLSTNSDGRVHEVVLEQATFENLLSYCQAVRRNPIGTQHERSAPRH